MKDPRIKPHRVPNLHYDNFPFLIEAGKVIEVNGSRYWIRSLLSNGEIVHSNGPNFFDNPIMFSI